MVDDYLPYVEEDKPVFAKLNEGKLWVAILEKAWAKLHQSYYAIKGGFPKSTMRDLTGAPSFNLVIKNKKMQYAVKKDEVF